MDTSTSAITVAVHDGSSVLAEKAVVDARAHAEHLAPLIVETLAAAGVGPVDVTDVAVGVGPGPFTGLRVGLVTAKTFAFACGVPCHGVVSLDALAYAALSSGSIDGAPEFVVATDARRKEVYLARYTVEDGRVRRQTDPEVIRPADIPEELRGLPAVGRGPVLYPEVLTQPVGLLDASAGALAEVALQQIAEGVEIGLDALYLRRPDAQPSVAPKSTIMAPRAQIGQP